RRHVLPRLPTVGRSLDQATVGPDPDLVFVAGRERDRVDHPDPARPGVRERDLAVAAGSAGDRARQVGADRGPGLATIDRPEEDLRGVVARVGVYLRTGERGE